MGYLNMKLIKIKENFYVVGKAEEGLNPEVKYFDNKVDENSIHRFTIGKLLT
jgi:hypothetical protein